MNKKRTTTRYHYNTGHEGDTKISLENYTVHIILSDNIEKYGSQSIQAIQR